VFAARRSVIRLIAAKAREAASSHARLGGLYLGRKCHPVEGVIVTAPLWALVARLARSTGLAPAMSGFGGPTTPSSRASALRALFVSAPGLC
jgi:hypothetical protein